MLPSDIQVKRPRSTVCRSKGKQIQIAVGEKRLSNWRCQNVDQNKEPYDKAVEI